VVLVVRDICMRFLVQVSSEQLVLRFLGSWGSLRDRGVGGVFAQEYSTYVYLIRGICLKDSGATSVTQLGPWYLHLRTPSPLRPS
jgi:hypothetical protein